MRTTLRDQLYANVISSMTAADFIQHFENLVATGMHPISAYNTTTSEWNAIHGKPLFKSLNHFKRARYYHYKTLKRKATPFHKLAIQFGAPIPDFKKAVASYRSAGLTHKQAFVQANADHERNHGYTRFGSFDTYIRLTTKQP